MPLCAISAITANRRSRFRQTRAQRLTSTACKRGCTWRRPVLGAGRPRCSIARRRRADLTFSSRRSVVGRMLPINNVCIDGEYWGTADSSAKARHDQERPGGGSCKASARVTDRSDACNFTFARASATVVLPQMGSPNFAASRSYSSDAVREVKTKYVSAGRHAYV
jgi:hypothetical protein